jgi:hypothetical protein
MKKEVWEIGKKLYNIVAEKKELLCDLRFSR